MNKQLKLAIVEWEDAASFLNKSLEDVINSKPLLARTFGILTKIKGYHIVTTHDSGIGDSDSDFVKIPNVLIKKVTFLKPE